MKRVCLGLSLLFGQACFATAPLPAPERGDAPALEARVRAGPADLGAISSLALLHLREGRHEEARALLAPVVEALPNDPAMPLLLAIADELAGEHTSARDRYQAYREGHVGTLARRAEERLLAIEAAALRAEVQRSLELPVDSAGPDSRLVAVLPFARSSSDETAVAEATGVAALVEWDLSDGWDVVSGARVRVLLEELGVAVTDFANLSVGVEVGRRLGAARVVQGSMRRPTVQSAEWDITVLSLDGPSAARVDHLTLSGPVGQVLPMQQSAAIMVRGSLEERFIEDRSGPLQTVSPDALVTLGRGLLAMDRGDAAGARDAFDRAVELDGAFAEARALSRRMDAVLSATPANEMLEDIVRLGEMQRAVQALRTSPSSQPRATMTGLGRSDRAAVSEILGLDAVIGNALLELTFVLPGG